jgi:hypothetical protein
MNRKHIKTSLWVAVVLFCVPGFLFALPGDYSQPSEPRPLSEEAAEVSGPVQSAPHIVQYFEARSITAGVELVWSAISQKDISGFSIYRRDPDSYQFLLINQEGLIGPWMKNYVDGDVQPATTYQYALAVVHADGSEALSDPAEVTTRRGRPKRRMVQNDGAH